MKWIGLAALLLAALGPAMAAPRTPWLIDPERSEARFQVRLRLAPPTPGHFGRVEGELTPLGKDRWQVQVRIDARALTVDGPEWLERSTRSAKFLAVDRHPEIRFVSQPFAAALLTRGGALKGSLELRGQRRDVSFQLDPAGCARPGRDCDLRVEGAIDRRDFGMRGYRLILRDRVDFVFHVRLRGRGRGP